MLTEAELLEHVLELGPAQRAALAQRVLESLEPEDADHDVDKAWADEIERRATAFDRGESGSVDAGEAIERIRKSLRESKAT